MGTLDDAALPGSPQTDPFTDHFATIHAVLRFVSWRHHLSQDEAQEFDAWVRLRLIERDFAILRKFRGDSSLETYLSVVVNRLFLDYKAAVRGKFRPSVAARAMGDVGLELERLLVLQKHTLTEAFEILRNRGFTFSEDQLEALAVRLPVRRSQMIVVAPEDLEDLARGNDGAVGDQERLASRCDLLKRLIPRLRALPREDRLMIRLHFLDGVGIAAIARSMKVDEQPLRRRLQRVLRDLREALEKDGVNRSVLKDLFP
jgi:RNA polymerase sigma factor for flagellar operon FliA